ncbi:hypothetical protein [Synechococcus sp. PCC 7336]|uniref:DUF7219 family protein n=1 Tax=Synechococcus sp. PCC 7336 TaxID=195250 RepID=UPI00035CA8C7|nr:hypothetical protein [Synechococcus sp. PCC 7336]
MADKDDIIYPRFPFRGDFTPEDFVFNANLQEFALKIGYIVSLQSNGKLTSEESYRQIKALWKELKISKKELGIGDRNERDSQSQ